MAWGSWYQHRVIPTGGAPWPGWVVTPQQSVPDMGASPAWPSVATAARRAPAYTVVVTPAQPDALQPQNNVAWPDFARAPRRQLDYTFVVQPEIGDASQPPGIQLWPHAAPPARRALDYTIAVVAPQPDLLQPAGTPAFPSLARAPLGGQTFVVTPAQPDALQPSGSPVFPSRAVAPLRGDTFIVTPAQPDELQPAGTPAFPGRARAPLGGQTFVVAPAAPDRDQPPGSQRWPHAAPAARRARDYTLIVQPEIPDSIPSLATPAYPHRAPAPRRAGATAYLGAVTIAAQAPPVDLGRYRLGDVVSLAWLPGVAQAEAPTAVITGPLGVVDSPQLSTRDRVTWNLHEFLGANFPLGSYTILLTSGAQYGFTVVAGGDPAGQAIAMLYTKNVQGHRVLVQTKAGELLLGTDPKLP